MKTKCDNCQSEFRDDKELAHVFPDIPGLFERITPGEPVPAGECPNCGALVHLCSEVELICTICGDSVNEADLREHLRQHNPNAQAMDWDDVRNVFRLAGDGDGQTRIPDRIDAFKTSRGFRPLRCPGCGVEGRIAQLDLIPGHAKIYGVYADGTIEWDGETNVDWDNQHPASDPPTYVCLACGDEFAREQLGIK